MVVVDRRWRRFLFFFFIFGVYDFFCFVGREKKKIYIYVYMYIGYWLLGLDGLVMGWQGGINGPDDLFKVKSVLFLYSSNSTM